MKEQTASYAGLSHVKSVSKSIESDIFNCSLENRCRKYQECVDTYKKIGMTACQEKEAIVR